MKKYLPTIGAGLLFACLLLMGVLLGVQFGNRPPSGPQEATSTPADTQEQSIPPQTVGAAGTVAIPGYDTIILRAGQRTQNISLVNPGENSCYFVLSLLLPDGTLIYQSGYVSPGREINSIKLLKVPAVGIYEGAILRYSCWSENEGTMTEINGVDTICTLEVIP